MSRLQPATPAAIYVASERAKDFALIFPEAEFEVAPPDLPSNTASRDDAILAMISGWMMHSGPITAAALGYRLGVAIPTSKKLFCDWKRRERSCAETSPDYSRKSPPKQKKLGRGTLKIHRARCPSLPTSNGANAACCRASIT